MSTLHYLLLVTHRLAVDSCQREPYRGQMARPTHPDKDIEDALRDFESAGWSVEKSGARAHIWGRAKCPANRRGACSVSVYSTPKSGQNHAKNLRRALRICECVTTTRKEKT